jgi:hypothetical protein
LEKEKQTASSEEVSFGDLQHRHEIKHNRQLNVLSHNSTLQTYHIFVGLSATQK